MKTRKKPPVKFTKQKMIDDINSLRKTTMKCQLITSDISKLYPSLYNYKIVNNLIQLGLLRLAQKKGKSSYYKWNFDSKVDLETFDALFRNVIAHKKNVKQKYAQNKIIEIKKQELIKSQEKVNLEPPQKITSPSFDLRNTKIWIGGNRGLSKRVQEKAFDLGWQWNSGHTTVSHLDSEYLIFWNDNSITYMDRDKSVFDREPQREIFESDLFPEVKEEKQLSGLGAVSFTQQLMCQGELTGDLGLVPTEEEIEAWKKEIAYWKHESESLRIKLEKESIELQSLKTEIEVNDFYINDLKYKHQEELNNVAKRYEKILSEKQLEPTFVAKEEDKKPFVPVLDEIKKQKIESQKPTKYLKLFGYMIYEKN